MSSVPSLFSIVLVLLGDRIRLFCGGERVASGVRAIKGVREEDGSLVNHDCNTHYEDQRNRGMECLRGYPAKSSELQIILGEGILVDPQKREIFGLSIGKESSQRE